MSDPLHSILVLLFFADMAIMLSVGGRLLAAAARNRRAAEAGIGSSAGFGAIGVILGLVATLVLQRDPGVFGLWAAGRVFTAAGIAGLSIGTWRIYYPDHTGAAAVAAAIGALAATGCAIETLAGFIPAPGESGTGRLLSSCAALVSYAWGAAEALRYHGRLRRRLRLGLADPAIAHRFLLWGVSGVCATASVLTTSLFRHGLGRELSSTAVPFAAVQVALFVAAVCLWLAFYPPAPYRRWRMRSARGGDQRRATPAG